MANYYLRLSANKKHWEIGELSHGKTFTYNNAKSAGRKHQKPFAKYPLAQEAEAVRHYQSLIQPINLIPKPRAIAINRRSNTGA